MGKPKSAAPLIFDRVEVILDSAQAHTARSVNTTQVVANWLIGMEIVEEQQQQGAKWAGLGEKVISELAADLNRQGRKGYGELMLSLCRQFCLAYPSLPGEAILYAVRKEGGFHSIGHEMRSQSAPAPAPAAQLYTNYYEQERLTPVDNPTLGLILCPDLNQTAVRYTLGPGQQKYFSSRYQFHLPTEADLPAEIRRELAELTPGKTTPSPRKKR